MRGVKYLFNEIEKKKKGRTKKGRKKWARVIGREKQMEKKKKQRQKANKQVFLSCFTPTKMGNHIYLQELIFKIITKYF